MKKLRLLKTMTESLDCKLTDSEFKERAEQLGAQLEDIRGAADRHASQKSAQKSEMAALEAKRDLLAMIVRRHAEERDVQVEVHADDAKGVVSYTRMDTGEVYHERPMSAAERQVELTV